jgi:HSP20 family protein
MFVVPFTTTLRHDPRQFARLVDDRLDHFFGATAERAQAARSPALDLVESDAGYTVTLDMPGVAKEDVKVAVDGRVVTINAQTQVSAEARAGDKLIHRERSASRYARSFSLPLEVDQADAVAKLEHGVLTLTLPKRVARSAAQITIN